MIKMKARRWLMCMYCHKQIYTREPVLKIKGIRYYIHLRCKKGE